MAASQPPIITTTPGTAAAAILETTGATGGNTSIATTGVGGVGAAWTVTGGAGGVAASADTASTGGKGGTFTKTAGTGGAAAAAGTNVGGAGGDYVVAAGDGGNASGGTSNTGGNGGSYYVVGGAAGTGATANGSVGNVVLGHTSSGTERGQTQFGKGTVSLPGLAFYADTDSGIYWIGANNLGVAVNGAVALNVATTGVSVAGALLPTSTDGGALGSATKMWSDLFLASGAVVNFNNGNITWTHSAAKIVHAGGELNVGSFHSSTAGSGIPLSATQTAAFRGYGDDVAAAISSATFVRTVLGRTLLNYNGTQECEAGGVVGQLVASTTTVGHNDAGTWGSWEAVGTVTTAGTASDNIHAGVLGRVGAGASVTLTVAADSVLAGVAAMSNVNTSATATYTGIYAGFYAGAWASADAFPYGIYIAESIEAAYFNSDAGTIASESHGVDVVATGTLASGKGLVGLNVVTTTAGTAGAWASGIYAKVVQGATKNVNGYLSAAEFEVVNSADNVSDNFVLVLNSNNAGASVGSHQSYIALREYGATKEQSLFWFGDQSIGTLSATTMLSTTNDQAPTHTIRFIIGGTPYWILCRNVAPA